MRIAIIKWSWLLWVPSTLLAEPLDLPSMQPATESRKPSSCKTSLQFTLPSAITNENRSTLVLPLETNLPVKAQADRIELDSEQVKLEGDVYLQQGDWQAFGQRLEHSLKSNQTLLEGPVGLFGQQFKIESDSAQLNFKTEGFTLFDADYALTENNQIKLRGQADSLDYRSNQLHIQRAWLNSCPENDNSWSIGARAIRVNKDSGWGTAKHAVFRIGKLPVFYLPWFRFPISDRRQSGFLIPDVRIANDGLDISMPFYFNVASHFDAIITPRWIADRGAMASLDVRHLAKYMNNSWHASYLHEDQLFNGQVAKDDFKPSQNQAVFKADSRWQLQWQHQGNWPRHLTTYVQYNKTSDDSYFRDLGRVPSINRQGTLTQALGLQYDKPNWFFSAQSRAFQTLDQGLPQPYKIKPSFNLNIHPISTGPLKWRLDSHYTEFDRANAAQTGIDALTGSRLMLAPRLTYRKVRPYGHVYLNAAWRHRRYDLKQGDTNASDRQTHNNGLFSLDALLKLKRNPSGNASHTQILIPRVYYLWSQRTNQNSLPLFDASSASSSFSLFRENRFSGNDRLGDAHHLSFGVTSIWQNNKSARESVKFFVGSLLRFKSQKVTTTGRPRASHNNSLAPMIMKLDLKPAKPLSLSAGWHYNLSSSQTSQLILGLKLKQSERRLLNFSYKERQGRKRAGTSIYWPLPGQLQLGAAWYYNLDADQHLERLIGLEYNHCCWRIRVGWHDFSTGQSANGINRSDKSIFFQFSLKGLGHFRTSSSDVYQESIEGFREPEEWVLQ